MAMCELSIGFAANRLPGAINGMMQQRVLFRSFLLPSGTKAAAVSFVVQMARFALSLGVWNGNRPLARCAHGLPPFAIVVAVTGALLEAAGGLVTLTCAANLVAALAVIAFSRPFSRQHESIPLGGDTAILPFISVHVATHDEPPKMVIETLRALARLDYPSFEIIVIDNNTPDPAIWEPVARYAGTLGQRVRYVHRMGVKGAKAGALNIALELTDPRATHIAVVDADYQVAPDFLLRGAAALGPDVQFVQFPQSYRSAAGADAVIAELSDYFHTFPNAANRAQATLLTGTLSIIAIDALRLVGGWPTGSITEDAELGVRLWSSEAKGLFVAERVGHGLLPLDLAGLRLQRQRWVRGNVQTLLSAGHALRTGRAGAIDVIAQLTAWTGFLAVPLCVLILAAGVRASGSGGLPWLALAEALAVATLLAVLCAHLVRALVRQRPASIAVTMALLWTSSFAWLSVLTGRPLKFRRTPKSAAGSAGPALSVDSIAGILALAAGGVFALDGALLTAAALALSASGLATAPVVDSWLRNAAKDTYSSCAA